MSEVTLAAIVPARDEARHIGAMLAGLPPTLCRIVVIDDGSTDGTGAIARALGDPRIEVLRHERARGVGAAIAAGLEHLLTAEGQSARLTAAVVMAGDGQMDPADLDGLCARLADSDVDLVWGDRWAGPTLAAMPTDRRCAVRVLTWLTRIASGDAGLGDSQCGFVVFRLRSLAQRPRMTWHPTYGYPNDLLIRVCAAGLRVAHAPVRAVYGGQRSGIRPLRDLPRIGWILLRGWQRRLWCFEAARMVGLAGALSRSGMCGVVGGVIAGGFAGDGSVASLALAGLLALIAGCALDLWQRRRDALPARSIPSGRASSHAAWAPTTARHPGAEPMRGA